jgi:hypothetical protein
MQIVSMMYKPHNIVEPVLGLPFGYSVADFIPILSSCAHFFRGPL